MANERRSVPWPVWLLCCAWPLALPVANYLRLRNANAALSSVGQDLQHQFSDLATRYLVAQSVVALSLSFLTCLAIQWHLRRSTTGTPRRILVDVLLLLAFLFAPWLAASIFDGRPARELANLFVGPGFLERLAPCASALLAGVSFGWVATSRGKRHVQEVA